MTALRTQDKIVLCLLVPALVIAAYVWLWRMDAAEELAALEAREASLVTVEEHPAEKAAAERRLEEAKAALAAEKAKPQPERRLKASAAETVSERERKVLGIFRDAGLGVLRSEIDAKDVQDKARGRFAAAEATLKATGLRPEPVRRVYTLDGGYPAVKRALDELVKAEAAVVPVLVEMKPGEGSGRWRVALWL